MAAVDFRFRIKPTRSRIHLASVMRSYVVLIEHQFSLLGVVVFARPCRKFAVAVVSCAVVTGTALAQELPGVGAGGRPAETVDCTQVSVDFTDDPTLTAQEKIQRMDQALMRSLARYEACQNAQASAGGGGGGGGGQAGGGGGMTGSEGDAGTAGHAGSLASTDMTGTEPPPRVQPAAELGDDPATDSATDRRQPQAADNGKIPEDIPSADNDSALEAQIRQAAMSEKDPEVRAQLWNEYRKYKGLPPAN